MKQILLTGASRGIGRETAIELARRGHRVFATMRQPEECAPFPEELPISLHALDVQEPASITAVVEEMGQIDVVINNAGYGIFGPVELIDDEEISRQFDVNVFGVLRVIRAVLPKMRAQKSGQIINISSIAGVANNPFVGVYCASKHALEALSESLASNMRPWNIHVSVVEPGPVATEFADVMPVTKNLANTPYEPFSLAYLDELKQRLQEGQPASEIAEVIADVVDTPKPNFRYQTSKSARDIVSDFIKDPDGNRWIDSQEISWL